MFLLNKFISLKKTLQYDTKTRHTTQITDTIRETRHTTPLSILFGPSGVGSQNLPSLNIFEAFPTIAIFKISHCIREINSVIVPGCLPQLSVNTIEYNTFTVESAPFTHDHIFVSIDTIRKIVENDINPVPKRLCIVFDRIFMNCNPNLS